MTEIRISSDAQVKACDTSRMVRGRNAFKICYYYIKIRENNIIIIFGMSCLRIMSEQCMMKYISRLCQNKLICSSCVDKGIGIL